MSDAFNSIGYKAYYRTRCPFSYTRRHALAGRRVSFANQAVGPARSTLPHIQASHAIHSCFHPVSADAVLFDTMTPTDRARRTIGAPNPAPIDRPSPRERTGCRIGRDDRRPHRQESQRIVIAHYPCSRTLRLVPPSYRRCSDSGCRSDEGWKRSSRASPGSARGYAYPAGIAFILRSGRFRITDWDT